MMKESCGHCGRPTWVNNYPDHKPRRKMLLGVLICAECVHRMKQRPVALFGVRAMRLMAELECYQNHTKKKQRKKCPCMACDAWRVLRQLRKNANISTF